MVTSILLYPYFKGDDGKPFINQKVFSNVHIYFNNPFVIAGAPLIADIYTCPRKAADFHDFPFLCWESSSTCKKLQAWLS